MNLYTFLATWSAGVFALSSVLGVSADTFHILNPLDTPAVITSDWNHQSGEKSLDLVKDAGRDSSDASVIWRLNNVGATYTVYYEVSEYGGSCDGQTYRIYTHTTPYDYVTGGYVHYVHMYGYDTGRSANITPEASEAFTVGWLLDSDDGCYITGPHVHHGKVNGGDLIHASGLQSTNASGTNYDVTSNDTTIYY